MKTYVVTACIEVEAESEAAAEDAVIDAVSNEYFAPYIEIKEVREIV